jgi:hypothetical protein
MTIAIELIFLLCKPSVTSIQAYDLKANPEPTHVVTPIVLHSERRIVS